MILDYQSPKPGRSTRGSYLSNQWYGHQDLLLAAAGLDANRGCVNAKMQIGWQPGTGLDGEQGFKIEVKAERLPFLLWGRRHLKAAESQGLKWGHAIGAPFLYAEFDPEGEEGVSTIKSALAFPCHSIEGYPVVEGWRAYTEDLVAWAEARGLGATVCLHPLDYVREDVVTTVAQAGATPACLGGMFDPRYLHTFCQIVKAHEIVVVDSATSAMFYAAALGKSVFCRGNPLRTSPYHPDDSVEKDHVWVHREFPWSKEGGDGQEHALYELGTEYKRSKTDLRSILTGETPQADYWRGEEGSSYAVNKTPTEKAVMKRAHCWSMMLKACGEPRFQSVLEVGCGGGANLAALRIVRPGVLTCGIEVNEEARKIASRTTPLIYEGRLPHVADTGGVGAEFVLTSGVLIHLAPEFWRPAVADLVQLSNKYVFLLEYPLNPEDAGKPYFWNGHLGRADFGVVLEDCGCKVIAKGEVPEVSELGGYYWLAEVGSKEIVVP